MGTTVEVKRIPAIVGADDPFGEEASDDGPNEVTLDLDKSWGALVELLHAAGVPDPLGRAPLSPREVRTLAAKLRPLDFSAVAALLESSHRERRASIDDDYVAAYYDAFRDFVIETADESAGLDILVG